MGRLGGFLVSPGAILGVLKSSWTVLEASWALLGALLARLGALWPLENPRDRARERAGTPRKFENLGPQPLEYHNPLVRSTENRELQKPEDTPLRASRHGVG